MIIISNKDIENSVYFPRNLYTETNDVYTVVLNDRATNNKYTFNNLDDKHLVQFGFYTFFVDFSELPEGEYEYKLYSVKERKKEFLVPYDKEDEKVYYEGEIKNNGDFFISYYNYLNSPQYMYIKPLDKEYKPFVINYFNNEGDELPSSKIRYNEIEIDEIIPLNIPKSTSYYIVNNLNEEIGTDYFKPFVYIGEEEKELVGTGLIRLNELEADNIYYNNETTYVVYDKQ